MLEAVKRDLDEISSAVRTEVTYAGSAIGETLRLDDQESTANTVKRSLSSFFGQVSEALVPTIDEDEDTEAILITKDGSVTLTGFQKHLAELQMNDATYLTEPDDSLLDNYQRWLEIADQALFTQNQLAKQLSSSDILNEKYLALVPDRIPHMEFWKRYLFRRALLEDALANAEIAERRARNEARSTNTVSPKIAAAIIQTEQPKKTPSSAELDTAPEEVVAVDATIVTTATTADTAVVDESPIDLAEAVDELNMDDADIKWDADDFGTDEISEEEQARLLQEYEEEIQEREKRKSQIVSLEEKVSVNYRHLYLAYWKLLQRCVFPLQLHGKQSPEKTSTPTTTTTNTNPKSTAEKGKDSNKKTTAPKTQSTAASSANKTPATKAAPASGGKAKGAAAKGKQQTKSDALKIQKNHFKDASPTQPKSLAEDLKSEVDAASDESWEKDFDLN